MSKGATPTSIYVTAGDVILRGAFVDPAGGTQDFLLGNLGSGTVWVQAPFDGAIVGLLDISKPRGSVFLDRLETLLTARGLKVERFAKPTFTKPAPADLRHEIAAQCDMVIEALAD